MTGIRKSKLIYHRKSKRISIRNPEKNANWVSFKKYMPDNKLEEREFYWLMNRYIETAYSDLQQLCPYAVVLDIHTALWGDHFTWIDEHIKDRWCIDSDTQIIRFKSKKDAAYFKLVWG